MSNEPRSGMQRFFGGLTTPVMNLLRELNYRLWLCNQTLHNKVIRVDNQSMTIMAADYCQKDGCYKALCLATSTGELLEVTLHSRHVATEQETIEDNWAQDKRVVAERAAAAPTIEAYKEWKAKHD